MPELFLYYKSTCPYCHKVLQFMEQENISIPIKDISANSENRQKLVEIGGKQQVPCLVIDGKALYESDAIIQWLEENWPG